MNWGAVERKEWPAKKLHTATPDVRVHHLWLYMIRSRRVEMVLAEKRLACNINQHRCQQASHE